MAEIVRPTIAALAKEGWPYQGVLYVGLMITAAGPRVVEFNCRFGDPECQAILPRLDEDLLPSARGGRRRTRAARLAGLAARGVGVRRRGLRRLSRRVRHGRRITGVEEAGRARRRHRLPRGDGAARRRARHRGGPRARRAGARRRTSRAAMRPGPYDGDRIGIAFSGMHARRDIGRRARSAGHDAPMVARRRPRARGPAALVSEARARRSGGRPRGLPDGELLRPRRRRPRRRGGRARLRGQGPTGRQAPARPRRLDRHGGGARRRRAGRRARADGAALAGRRSRWCSGPARACPPALTGGHRHRRRAHAGPRGGARARRARPDGRSPRRARTRAGRRRRTTAAAVRAYFDGRVELILDGGPTAGGTGSTVADCTVVAAAHPAAGPVSVEAS